jgi:proteic killer suppression protein
MSFRVVRVASFGVAADASIAIEQICWNVLDIDLRVRSSACTRANGSLVDDLHATRVVRDTRVVIQSFADETTVDLFRERNPRAARRLPRDLWRVVQRKLKLLDAAGRLDDLAVPGNRLELLKGDQTSRHSIRVNDKYRVTFRWENGHAYEVRVEDYH